MTDSVTIVPYDPEWPRRFNDERHLLSALFAGSDALIEHVGSTAVPGLGAKPVIDVMIGVPHLFEVERRISALEGAGYEYVQAYEQQLPARRYLRKPRSRPRMFHLHCVVTGTDFWIRHLTFRDYLRANPEAAAAYGALKRDLAMRVSKEDYTEAKSPFIEGILTSAMRDRENRLPGQSETAPGQGVTEPRSYGTPQNSRGGDKMRCARLCNAPASSRYSGRACCKFAIDSDPIRRPSSSGAHRFPTGLYKLRPCEKRAGRITSGDVNREAVHPAYRLRR